MSEVTTGSSRRREALTGVCVAAGGLVLLLATFAIEEPPRVSPGLGPSVLPFVVSAGLILCGGLLTLSAARGRGQSPGLEDDVLGEDADDLDDLLGDAPTPIAWRNLGVIVALMVGYAFAFVPLGFIASTALFLFAVTTFVDPTRWLRNAIFGAVIGVGVYYLFVEALAVRLPSGILG